MVAIRPAVPAGREDIGGRSVVHMAEQMAGPLG